jgi:hypothetical protein
MELQRIFPAGDTKENIMLKWIKIISSLVLVLIFFTTVQAKPPMTVKMTRGEAQITALKGKAEVICAGQKVARDLKINDFVGVGCEVSTGAASRVEMVLPDKSIVRFAEKTKFKLVQADIGDDGKRAIKMSVPVGKIWTNVRKSLPGGEDKFEISCQNAVAGVRGTIYRMDVEGDQSALVKVYDGEVSVTGISRKQQSVGAVVGPPKPVPGPTVVEGPKPVSMEKWVYIVKSMQQIQITSDGQAREPEGFMEASEEMDNWVKWNKSRDKKHRK